MNKTTRGIIRTSQAISLIAMSGMVISPALSGIGDHFSHIPSVYIQMLVTIPSLCMIPATLLSSKIRGYLTCKKIYLGCLLLLLFGGVAPILVKNFFFMFFCRVLVGLAIGLMTPVNTAMVTSYLPLEQRTGVLGVNNAIESIGGAFMVIASGWLATLSWELCFVVYLLAILPLIVVLLRLDDNIEMEQSTEKQAQGFPRIILFFVLVLCLYMTFLNIFSTNISALIQEKSIGDSLFSGVIVAVYLLAGFFAGLLFQKADQLFRKHTFAVGILLCGIGLGLLALGKDVYSFLLGSIISGYGMGQAIPAALNLVNEYSPVEQHTFHISLLLSGSRIGQFMTTLIYVPIIHRLQVDVSGAYACSAVFLCILTGVLFISRRKRKGV